MYILILFYLFTNISAVPINVLQTVADNDFEKTDNYLPKVGDFPKFHYATVGENSENEVLDLIDFASIQEEKQEFKGRQKENGKTFESVVDFVREGAEAGMDLINDFKNMLLPKIKPENETGEQETTTVWFETTTEVTTQGVLGNDNLDPVLLNNDNSTSNRTIRQENDIEGDKDSNNTSDKENQESEEEEEEPDMITGLISAFLGGLSRPDGSVDVEAITGLLGSLSTQNEDGTYDFNGLTELLMSFFGGGGEEGGGSDFGAFLGGLAGAFIKGVANPPGAKGAGTFLGNLIGAVLPGLSAPAPTEEGDSAKPQPSLDSGGFISGLLSSVFGNLGGLSNSSGGGGDNTGGGGGSKFSLFKAIFSLITSIFSSSSAKPH